MTESAVLVLDLGTSSLKGALYSPVGSRLALQSSEYPVSQPLPMWAEQEPAHYLEAARAVCRGLVAEAGRLGVLIEAVGFSTQTPTLVFCDGEGRATEPAIIWQDSRSGAEADWLLANTTAEDRRAWFGMDLPVGAASTPAKLLWMARNRSDVWRRTRWVLQPKDWLILSLTGEAATDPWCAKGMVHLRTGEPTWGFLRILGKEESVCPRLLRPEQVAGAVTNRAAVEYGLPEGTRVIEGWSDALCGIFATGALHSLGRGFVITGTSEIVGVGSAPRKAAGGLFWVPEYLLDLKGLGAHFGPTQAGGSCLEWLAAFFSKPASELLALIPPLAGKGLSPILCRPYFHGERAPYWDHTLAASFEGIRAEHGAAQLVHAVLQGVAMQERLVLERAEDGVPVDAVVLAGGGARDDAWNRIRANVLQRTLIQLGDAEASLQGAALLAFGATGRIALKHPPEGWFAGREIQPDPACAEAASRMMERFRQAPKHILEG